MSDSLVERSGRACVGCKDGSGGGDGSDNRKTAHNKSDGIRFHNITKHLLRRRSRPRGGGGNSSSTSSSSSSQRFNKRNGGGSKTMVVGGCWCFKESATLESLVESQTSDPNSSEFNHEMLRVLIEKNDFYSKECNPHLD